MTHISIYNRFVLYFPQFADVADSWFPNGKNSIRIRIINDKDYVFTYNSKHDWRLETVDSFVRALNNKYKKE